ncbi:MAG TPA: hypothetical protein VIG64_07865 [Actinomycetota bacterium]|jgi:hypothetical protein
MAERSVRAAVPARPASRSWACLAAAALAVVVLTGTAHAEPYQRTVLKTYTGFGGTTASEYPNLFVQDQLGSETVGGIFLGTQRDRFVSVSATDTTGATIALRLVFTPPGASEFTTKLVCGGTERRVAVAPKSALQVFPLIGTCGDTTPSIPTRGQITATFTR